MYCLMSALSTKARSMVPVMLEVVMIRTLLYCKDVRMCDQRKTDAKHLWSVL